jgi:hypothetical protein
LVSGSYPFEGETVFLLFETISQGEFGLPPDTSPDLAALLRGMLRVPEESRFSLKDVKESE